VASLESVPAATIIDGKGLAATTRERVKREVAELRCASLFLDWYGSRSAWSAFVAIDLVLLLTGAGGLALPVLRAAHAGSAIEAAAASFTALLGLSASGLVVFRVLVPPVTDARAAGLFVGLVAAIGVLVGAIMSVGDEHE